jgi:hypothetical protein
MIPLVNVVNMKHELVVLSQRIDWKSIEKDFALYYADMGRPAVNSFITTNHALSPLLR